MAEQQNLFSYSGKLNDMVGYRRGGKYFLRKKANPYVLHQESQKKAKEFGLASKASVLLRKALGHLFLSPFKINLHNRLSKIFGEIIRSGIASENGERQVFDGHLGLLKGFEFSGVRSFDRLVSLMPSCNVMDKEVWIDLGSSDPDFIKDKPAKAERIRLMIGNAWIDFTNANYNTLNASPVLHRIGTPFKGGRLKVSIPQEGEWALVVMVTVCFDRDSSGPLSMIGNKRYQAGKIAGVLHFLDGNLVEREYVIADVEAKKEDARGNDLIWEEIE